LVFNTDRKSKIIKKGKRKRSAYWVFDGKEKLPHKRVKHENYGVEILTKQEKSKRNFYKNRGEEERNFR
jgi:hypothetical protein